jgi:hypothetical protein
MNPKNTWLLVALTLGLFAFIYFYERRIPEVPPVSNRIFQGLNAAAVTLVQVHPAGQLEIRVERGNGIWLMTKPVTYPAQSEALDSFVRAVATLEHRMHISAQELRNHHGFSAEYGLDNPQLLITLTDVAGEQHLLKIGAFTAPGDQLYAEVVGQEGVDVVDVDSIKKYLPTRADDWREAVFLPPFKDADFDTLTVSGGQNQFVLHRESTNSPWQMTSPVQSRADDSKINELLGRLKTLRVTAFKSDDPRADLEQYGLAPPPLELRFEHGTNRLALLEFGKSAGTNDSQIYARRNGEPSVVLLPREPVVPWQGGFQDFRDPRLARVDKDRLRRIDLENDGDNRFFILREGDSGDWMIHAGNETLPVSTNMMNDFIGLVTNLQVARINQQLDVRDAVSPDTNSLLEFGLVNPSRRITLRGGDPSAAGPATNILAQLDFGLVKDGMVFVRRADRPSETSVYGIPAADLQSIPASPLQFRGKQVWDFSPEDVSKVSVSVNGVVREILHTGTNEWKLAAGSQGIFNPFFIELGVQELGMLKAADWVQRGDDDSARFGFSGTNVSITVDIREKNTNPAKELKLELGGVSPRGLRYGMTTLEDGHPWIFEIPNDHMDHLTPYFGLPEAPGP